MRVSFAAVVATCLALSAVAAEEGAARTDWHTYAMAGQMPAAKSAPDSYAAAGQPERVPLMKLKTGATCGSGEFQACIDSTGRITVPGARRFLPELPGLKPERLTVKRSGIVFRYSF